MKTLLTAYAVWTLSALPLAAQDYPAKRAELAAAERTMMAEREQALRIRTNAIDESKTSGSTFPLPAACRAGSARSTKRT